MNIRTVMFRVYTPYVFVGISILFLVLGYSLQAFLSMLMITLGVMFWSLSWQLGSTAQGVSIILSIMKMQQEMAKSLSDAFTGMPPPNDGKDKPTLN